MPKEKEKRSTNHLDVRGTSPLPPRAKPPARRGQHTGPFCRFDGCADFLENDFPGRGWAMLDDGVNCGTRGPTNYVTPPLWDGDETWSSVQVSSRALQDVWVFFEVAA